MSTKKKKAQVSGYNWEVLKYEFMQGPWTSTAQYRRAKGFSLDAHNPGMTVKMGKWAREKEELLALAAKEAIKGLVKTKGNSAEEVRQKHADIGRKLQQKGLDALEKLGVTDVEQARKLILAGIDQEKEALGITWKGGTPSSLTQVNVNLPKTRFDEILDGEDYAGILRLLAEIKRERVTRGGKDSAPEGKAETNTNGA